VAIECPAIRLGGIHPDEIERLFPTAVLGRRFKAELFHTFREIGTCHLVALAARASTFVAIVTDFEHDATQVISGNLFRGLFRRQISTCGSIGYGRRVGVLSDSLVLRRLFTRACGQTASQHGNRNY